MRITRLLVFAIVIAALPVSVFAKEYSLDECIDISIRESEKIKAMGEGEKAAESGKKFINFRFFAAS
ncbi:MAG: hypothetical protein ACOX2F_10120 [bacterium]